MQRMPAEPWDTLFWTEALTFLAPGGTGCCSLQLCTALGAVLGQRELTALCKATPMPQELPHPKVRWCRCRNAKPGCSVSLGNSLEGPSQLHSSPGHHRRSPLGLITDYFFLHPHTRVIPEKAPKHLTYKSLPRSLFPRPRNLRQSITSKGPFALQRIVREFQYWAEWNNYGCSSSPLVSSVLLCC